MNIKIHYVPEKRSNGTIRRKVDEIKYAEDVYFQDGKIVIIKNRDIHRVISYENIWAIRISKI